MTVLNKIVMVSLVIIVALTVSKARAQFYYDPMVVYEAATENSVLPGARAAGMGGAQIAAGNDGAALWYNPAQLTRMMRSELSGTLTHRKFSNDTFLRGLGRIPETEVSNTRLGSLSGTYRVQTYRGGMVIGFAINRVKSFDKVFRYSSSPNWLSYPYASSGWGGGEDESGGLWAWSFGGAVEISPRVSVGLSLDLFDGNDDWMFFFDSTLTSDNYRYSYTHNINDEYTGISGKLGISYDVDNIFNISGVIGLPSSITVDQTSEIYEFDNQRLDDSDFWTTSYRYTLPFWLGIGGQARFQDFIITGDVSYADYSQLQYRSGLDDIGGLNQSAQHYYDDTFTYRIGGEYTIPSSGTKLRVGYYQEPIAFKGFDIDTQPHYFTFGAGFVVDRSIGIDIAYLTGSWQKNDPVLSSSEKYDTKRFMVTVSYRL